MRTPVSQNKKRETKREETHEQLIEKERKKEEKKKETQQQQRRIICMGHNYILGNHAHAHDHHRLPLASNYLRARTSSPLLLYFYALLAASKT